MTVRKTSTGKLLTALYRKEINQQSHLHRISELPVTLKQSILFSQELRLKRICPAKDDFTKQSKALTNRLVERCYNKNEIQQRYLRLKGAIYSTKKPR